jgi:UDP-sugar transporter A1/2/3
VQLATFSVVFALAGSLYWDHDAIADKGFFQGYTPMVWVVVVLSALGGLIIAAVIKYADNILKSFANAMSIILSSLLSYFLLNDFTFTSTFLAGAPLVILAVFIYGYEKPRPMTPEKDASTV